MPGPAQLALLSAMRLGIIGRCHFAPRRFASSAQMKMQDSRPQIKAVFSDIDGTLLNSDNECSAETISTIKALVAQGTVFVPATGKCRAGALAALGPELSSLLERGGGVYSNGLRVHVGSAVLSEDLLSPACVDSTATFAQEHGLSLVGYSGDNLVTPEVTPESESLADVYYEPRPRPLGHRAFTLEGIADGSGSGAPPLNKLLLMGDAAELEVLRPLCAALLGEMASLTVALPTMLEVLPPDCSKGKGAARLWDHLGIEPRHVLAIGDGENDTEMLERVARAGGVAVVMGNARSARLRAVGNAAAASNDDGGAAAAFQKYCL